MHIDNSTHSTGNMVEEASHLDVIEFAKARLPELEMLESALEGLEETVEVPVSVRTTARHLRRRTRAYCSNQTHKKKRKRVVRNPKSRQPTRRVRRASLLQSRWPHADDDDDDDNDNDDDENKKKKDRLLETHKWHAKRFRMVTSDGFILAQSRNDRGLRAAARSLREHCVCFDATHFRPLILPERAALKKLLDPDCRHDNATYLYELFPEIALGPCRIQESDQVRITVHPRIRHRVAKVLEATSIPGGVLRFQLRGPQSKKIAQTVKDQYLNLMLTPIGHDDEPWSGLELSFEPGGSGARIWQAIIQAGAHAIGSSEIRFLRGVEIGLPTFPYDDFDVLPCLDRTKILRRYPSKEDLNDSLLQVRLLALRTGLPAETNTIFASDTDEIRIGRLTTAGFASSLGRGAGIGLVTYAAFIQLLKLNSTQHAFLPASVFATCPIDPDECNLLVPRHAFFQSAHSPTRHPCILIPIISKCSSSELPASSSFYSAIECHLDNYGMR